eukprot:scaffold275965_cov43-Tisochrysis_lutea.AAC.1
MLASPKVGRCGSKPQAASHRESLRLRAGPLHSRDTNLVRESTRHSHQSIPIPIQLNHNSQQKRRKACILYVYVHVHVHGNGNTKRFDKAQSAKHAQQPSDKRQA